MNTRDELGIFWPTLDGHVEVPGIEYYGFFPKGSTSLTEEVVRQDWPEEVGTIDLARFSQNTGDVVAIRVKVSEWPEDMQWCELLKRALGTLLKSGAKVTWCGGYDCSWSIEVLDPQSASGNVYAACTAETGFLCNSRLSAPIQFLNDSQLADLWKVVNSIGRQNGVEPNCH